MTAIPHRLPRDLLDDDLAVEQGHEHHEVGFLKKYLFSTDHKTIGIQFLFMGLFFMVVGGLLAMLIRWQLAYPSDPEHPVPILGKLMGWSKGVMPPEFYTMVFTMHATIMIFFVVIPLLVGTFGNYLIPLKIGAADMAFPFLNGVAFWSAVPAGTIMLAGFVLAGGASASGWTAYPPLSAITLNGGTQTFVAPAGVWDSVVMLLRPHDAVQDAAGAWSGTMSTWPAFAIVLNFIAFFLLFSYISAYYVRLGHVAANTIVGIALSLLGAALMVRAVQHVAWDGQSCWFASLFLLGFTSLMGAVNYLTTVIKLRCPA